jgi:hypothetical protein
MPSHTGEIIECGVEIVVCYGAAGKTGNKPLVSCRIITPDNQPTDRQRDQATVEQKAHNQPLPNPAGQPGSDNQFSGCHGDLDFENLEF